MYTSIDPIELADLNDFLSDDLDSELSSLSAREVDRLEIAQDLA